MARVSQSTPTGSSAEEKFLGGDKIVLLIALVTYGMGQTVLFVVFPPVVEEMGLSLTQYGLIFAISNLVLALGAPVWGRRSDRAGRKATLLVGLGGFIAGSILVALCIEWGLRAAPSAWVLFSAILTARLLYAALVSAIQPAATAYIADTTSTAQRAQGMALMGVAAGLGTILGPALGGGLAFVSVVFPMYVTAAIALLGLILVVVMLPEPPLHKAPEESSRLSPWDPRIVSFLVVWFFFFLIFTMLQLITAFYLEKHIGIQGSQAVAQATAVTLFSMAVVVVVVQAFVIQRYRIHPRTMLRLACPFFAAAMAILLVADSLLHVMGAYVLIGLSLSLAGPGINGGASLSVEPHEQGAVGGFLAAAPILGMVIGPLLGPVLFDLVSPTFPILVGFISLLLLSVYALWVKVPDPHHGIAPAQTPAA